MSRFVSISTSIDGFTTCVVAIDDRGRAWQLNDQHNRWLPLPAAPDSSPAYSLDARLKKQAENALKHLVGEEVAPRLRDAIEVQRSIATAMVAAGDNADDLLETIDELAQLGTMLSLAAGGG